MAAVQLNVWGRIEKQADPSGWVDEDGADAAAPTWGQCDVGWSLTKFQATIKNTSILSGEIAFRLDIRELFGKKISIDPINVAATLPAGRNSTAPRDFSFAATFAQPQIIEIDVQFIKALQLRGIKVGTYHNDTVLNVDADTDLQGSGFRLLQIRAEKGSGSGCPTSASASQVCRLAARWRWGSSAISPWISEPSAFLCRRTSSCRSPASR